MNTIFDLTFNDTRIERGTYENCIFENCNFTAYELNDYSFIECRFEECNLSNCNLSNSSFKDVIFNGCKMLGIDWSRINPFLLKVKFTKCQLNFSVFNNIKFKGSSFFECDLSSSDFTNTSLIEVDIVDCNLDRAVFENTDLQKANLKDSYNIVLDPRVNRLKGLKVPQSQLEGLLLYFGIKTIK